MIENIIFFVVLLSGSVFSGIRFQRKFEETLPLTCMSMVLIMFVFGVAGMLKYGVYAILLAAAGLYLYALWGGVRGQWKALIPNLLTPAFVLFCGFYILLNLCDFGKLASEWDEFSHWLDCVKAMTYLDDFAANPASGAAFQSYPPGMALFQYFLQKVHLLFDKTQVFCEWRMYLAYQILLIAPAFPFFRCLSFRKPGTMLLGGILLFLVPFLFYSGAYSLLYIDEFVGMLAGCGFLAVLLADGRDPWRTVYLALLCAVLVLAKDVGMYFACMIALAYFLSEALFRGSLKTPGSWRKGAFALTPMAFALGAKLTWKWVLRKNGSSVLFAQKIDLLEYTKMFFLRTDSTYRQTSVEHFKNAFFERLYVDIGGMDLQVSYFTVLVVMALLLYILCEKMAASRQARSGAIRMTGGMVFLQMVLYIYCLGATYVYRFLEVEALQLASYERYMNMTYLCVAVVLALGAFSHIQSCSDEAVRKLACLCLTAGMLIVAPMDRVVDYLNRDNVAESHILRAPHERMAEVILENCDSDDQVYFISQEEVGFDARIARFSARPVSVSSACGWSLGKPYSERDDYSRDISAEEWMDVLMRDYDYVAVYRSNDYFVDTFGTLFENAEEIADGTLYRINKQNRVLERWAGVSD